MTKPAVPKIREVIEIVYEDERTEKITVRVLRNTDWLDWIDAGFNKKLLVFRSVDRADTSQFANEDWLNSLKRSSARLVVETAFALNGADEETKKVLAAVQTNLMTFLSLLRTNSSAAAATTPSA